MKPTRWPSHLVLLISLAVSVLAALTIDHITKNRERARFAHATQALQQTLESGLNTYGTLLDSVRALAVAKVSMNSTQFHAFTEALDLRQKYPGIVGLGLALKISAAQKAELLEKSRRELTTPAFRIWPESELPELCPLIILEPQDAQNLAAIGYDLLTAPALLSAAVTAAESGQATATDSFDVDPRDGVDGGKGFAILIPVYREGGLPETVELRRAKLAAFVYCSFRTAEVLPAIIGKHTNSAIALRIYQGETPSDTALIYPTDSSQSPVKAPQFTSVSAVRIAQRPWTLAFAAQPGFTSGINATSITFFAGLMLSGLLWRITVSQTRAREAAEQHALQLRQSEGALRESEARRQRAETFSSIMVAEVSLDGLLLKVPAALASLLGYSESELLGQSFKSLTNPGDIEADERCRQRILSGEVRSADIEKRLITHSGGSAWIAVNYSLATDDRGQPLYFLTYIHDISERKRQEAEIQELNTSLEKRVGERTAELQAAVEDLEAFSYSVSHDLRAPIRHISVFVNLLKESPSVTSDEKAQRHATVVSRAAHRMGELIDALLNFSKLGRIRLGVRPTVDVNEIVREVCQILQPEIEKRTIDWRIENLPKVSADPILLRQVFANLLSNAVKYSAPRSEGIIEIGSVDRGEEIEFYVRDNGVGFDMNYSNKLFNVFQRLHSADEFEGTGIGLANIRKIISRHGGRTWAESARDRGATFYFTLPHRRSVPTV